MVGGLARKTQDQIVEAIRMAESQTSGEIRVHLERRCAGDVLEAARRKFLQLGMHRTKQRNGVLIFVALQARKFAILGDSGIDAKTGPAFWGQTRDIMAQAFEASRLGEGITGGVRCAGEKLKAFFPLGPDDSNELPNRVTQG